MLLRRFFGVLVLLVGVSARLQDVKEVVRQGIIPDADSHFWKICSESMVATSAVHVTLSMAVPRGLVDEDFVWSLTGHLGTITVMDAFSVTIIGRHVVALIVNDLHALDLLLDLNPRLWWPIAYYVISAPALHEENYKNFSRSLWDRYRVRNTILVVENSDRIVATYNPFILPSEGGQLSIFEVKGFSFVVEDYNTILNLHKLPVRITLFGVLPTAIPQSDGSYIGHDGMLLKTSAEKMNFTPIINGPADGEMYGRHRKDGTYSGALRDIVEERSDITFNNNFIQDHQSDKLDFTTYITQNKICFIVPKAGTMPRFITILNCFEPSVWLFTITSYLIFTIAYYFWDRFCFSSLILRHKTKRSAVFLESLKMFLNYAPKKLPYLDSGKLLIVSFILMSFVLINEFQGTFLTFLNRPIYYKDIDTLEELERSQLPIRTSFSSIENTLSQDRSLMGLVKNIEVVDFNERSAGVATSGTMTQQEGSGGLLRMDYFKMRYLYDFVKMNSSEPLHVVRECPLSYFMAYFVQRGSPFLDSFNTIIARCVTAGLVRKWSWDTNFATFKEMRPYRRGDDDKPYNSFTFADLQFPFLLYVIGISISIIVFILELWVFKFNKKLALLNHKSIIYVNEFPAQSKPSFIIK